MGRGAGATNSEFRIYNSRLIKVFFDFLNHHVQAEYHHMVAGLYLRVTHNYHTLAVAYQSADGCPFGQAEVFHRMFGYL